MTRRTAQNNFPTSLARSDAPIKRVWPHGGTPFNRVHGKAALHIYTNTLPDYWYQDDVLCILAGIFKLISKTVPIIDFYDIDDVLYWFKYIFLLLFSYVSVKLTYVVIFHMMVRIIMTIDEPILLMRGPWIALLVLPRKITFSTWLSLISTTGSEKCRCS